MSNLVAIVIDDKNGTSCGWSDESRAHAVRNDRQTSSSSIFLLSIKKAAKSINERYKPSELLLAAATLAEHYETTYGHVFLPLIEEELK